MDSDPHSPATPLYTEGKHDVTISGRTSDGHIRLDYPLFITASSEATASSLSSSGIPDYQFTAVNPISAPNPQLTEDMIGATFNFTSLNGNQSAEYQIVSFEIDPENPLITLITLNNLDGGADAIQTIDDNNLNTKPQVTLSWNTIVANEYTIQYKNSHLIFENEYHCTVDEDEYNHTLNPTARKLKDIDKGDLANFATGSNFKPYVTTVGLYNEGGELLVVGKLGQPIKMSDETDTTFVIRYDT